jgi:hypothetical protein
MNTFTGSKIISVLLLVAILVGLGYIRSGSRRTPVVQAQDGPITMVPGTVDVDVEIENAVRNALINALSDIPRADYYAITDVREEEKWLFVSVVGLNGLGPDLSWNLLDNSIWFGLILLTQDTAGHWIGATEGTVEFSRLLDNVPEVILSSIDIITI